MSPFFPASLSTLDHEKTQKQNDQLIQHLPWLLQSYQRFFCLQKSASLSNGLLAAAVAIVLCVEMVPAQTPATYRLKSPITCSVSSTHPRYVLKQPTKAHGIQFLSQAVAVGLVGDVSKREIPGCFAGCIHSQGPYDESKHKLVYT